MPVEEVIERGREVGIELQPSDIHAARYYMRQVAAADASSIPQQLLLGGTFVTKREPRGGKGAAVKTAHPTGSTSATSANGATSTNGVTSANGASSANAEKLDKLAQSDGAHGAQSLRFDDAAEDDVSNEPEVATPKARGRGKAGSKTAAKAANKAEPKANGANGLHSRLQARLRNATFRETAREERDEREQRNATSTRDVKATVGKALLLDLDNALKPRGKRAAKTTEAMEEQLRLIALRVGTQRAREILDEMEALAARA
jgi:hypothetical protein